MKKLAILNTRPAHQSKNLTDLLKKAGHAVFYLPVLEIKPVTFDILKMDDFDYVIFLSANAVNYFFAQNKSKKTSAKIIAIGSATQNTLQKIGFNHVICPAIFNSNGILDMPLLQKIHHQSILIVSGENSKPLLKTELEKRGAFIKTISCYQRKPISYDMAIIFPKMIKNKIDLVISTSMESFECLMRLFKIPAHHDWLLSKTLCVINPEMKIAAKEKGFQSVIQAENATDEEIVKSISQVSYTNRLR